MIAAVLVAIALAAGLGQWLTRAEDDPVTADAGAFVPLGPGSLVRIDADMGEIVVRVPVMYPAALASDGSSVWSLSDAVTMRQKLVRADAATNAVTGVFGGDAAGVWPSQLAVADGSVWLGNDSGADVYRIAPGASAAEPMTFAENITA